jgi:hypothetical protein
MSDLDRFCSACGREAPSFDSPEIAEWIGGDDAYFQGEDDPDPLMLEPLVCPECRRNASTREE